MTKFLDIIGAINWWSVMTLILIMLPWIIGLVILIMI